MATPKARPLFEATEGAAKKHLEKINSLPSEKHPIDWEAYSKVIKAHSDVVHDLKAKYEHMTIPYPNDYYNRMGAAEAEDLKIKKVRDKVLKQVADNSELLNKDRTFFRRLPQARSMTEEMYMEAFPNRHEVEPRSREKLEDEIETVNHHLDDFQKKREERKNL